MTQASNCVSGVEGSGYHSARVHRVLDSAGPSKQIKEWIEPATNIL